MGTKKVKKVRRECKHPGRIVGRCRDCPLRQRRPPALVKEFTNEHRT